MVVYGRPCWGALSPYVRVAASLGERGRAEAKAETSGPIIKADSFVAGWHFKDRHLVSRQRRRFSLCPARGLSPAKRAGSAPQKQSAD